MARENRVRLADDERRVLELTRDTVYDGSVPLGVVVARGCRSLLSSDSEDNGDDVTW